MTSFPRLDVLPEPQRRLWPRLAEVPPDFVLYGGTALALRLAHRQSADFDLFTACPFEPQVLQASLGFAADAEVLQMQPNTLTVRTAGPDGVKVSWFGGLRLAQVEPPACAPDNGLAIASLRDLFATKLNTLFQRAESKDYLDVHALLQAGLSLADGLACARAVFGSGFNPALPLKALTYFGDGDLSALSESVQRDLVEAVRRVTAIPVVTPSAGRIGRTGGKTDSTDDADNADEAHPRRRVKREK